MKFSHMTGSLLLAVGLAGGVFAAPAHADNSTSVDDFLNSLDKLGLGNLGAANAVDVGRSLCPVLAESGQNTADIASTVSDAIRRPRGPATMFTGTAISLLCPKAIENVTNDLADGKLPIPIFGN